MSDRDLYGFQNSDTRMEYVEFPGINQTCNSQTQEINNTLEMFKNKVKNGKRAIVRLKRQQEDTHLNTIMSDLLLLESHLRSEQTQILSQLATQEATISSQRQEIEKLRRDNRRLISRLKKITESRENREGKCTTRTSAERDDNSPGKKSSKRFSEVRPVKQSVMTTLASQFYEKSALCFTDENGKIIDRITHKPPIAEKPKVFFARASNRPVTAVVRTLNGQCNIVSTISRLLDEESDQGINGSSGSSEPSSPESTLKPVTPRVIKLARQYEKGITYGSSSSDSGRSGDDQSVRTVMMDEYEVTSGYNSDAVSDLDHDYENVLLYRDVPQKENGIELSTQEDDEDNYVVLRALRDEEGDIILVDDENQNIYSNIEYGKREKRDQSELSPAKNEFETNSSISAEEPSECEKNVPRSRHNINLVMSSSSKELRLMDNFEEFSLDSLDLEDLNKDSSKDNLPDVQFRHCGDGAETQTALPEKRDSSSSGSSQGGYEKFLEVTGLSQKSILTPMRMFSNHRSVLKPRDIKHRDKLRAVFTSLSTLEEVPSSPSGSETKEPSPSSQRYWRENFL